MRLRSALLAAVLLLTFCGAFTLAAAAAPPSISVPDTTYGGTTVATVTNDGKQNDVVFVQCWIVGTDEEPEFIYVYAAYFEITDSQATLGPFTSTLWTGGDALCLATHGWFTARGFGEWKVIATTTFQVAG